MFEKFTSTSVLGLFLINHTLKGCLISFSKKNLSIDHTFSILLPAQKEVHDVKPLYMIGNQSIEHIAQQGLSVSGLSALATLVRPLEIKLSKTKDIDAVLAFQAEPILPYPPESALLDKMITRKTETGTELALFAVPKEQMQDHLEVLSKWGIEPEVVSCVPAALASFAKEFVTELPAEASLFIAHLDMQETVCLQVANGKVFAAHPFPQGIHSLAQALAKDEQIPLEIAEEKLKTTSFEHLDPSSQLQEAYENFRLELVKAAFALPKQAKLPPADKILFTGAWGGAPSFCQKILSAVGKPQAVLKESENISSETLRAYAIPLGLALNAMPSAENPINFRQQEFVYPNPWKQFKTPLKLYFGLMSLITLLLFLFGKSLSANKEHHLREQFAQLLAQIHKSYDGFEKEYEMKMNPSQDQESPLIPLTNLSQEDLAVRLDYLQKQIDATPDVYALYPNIPRVSDVLAWLSSHPQVTLQQKEGSSTALLQIDSFSYTLVKRPEQSKKSEKYQAKVEIEFTTSTPKLAREFHDALLKPNDLIDPKGEIKWNPSRDRYRVSFFLKDKTAYPASLGGS